MTKLYLDYEPTAAYLDDAKREMFASRLSEARAARIRSPRSPVRRAERAAAEAALRRACRAAGETYAALTISYTESGKPYIEDRPDLALSLSHTATLAAVALVKAEDGAAAPQVGIDIMRVGDAPARTSEVADRYFSPAEKAACYEKSQGSADFQGFAPCEGSTNIDLSTDAFLSTWCRMEARVKMTGDGIGGSQTVTEPAARRAFVLNLGNVPPHFVAVALEADVTDA